MRERVKAVVAQARSRGWRHGRPATAFLQSERLRALFAQGKSKSEIARVLGVGRTSVRRSLADAIQKKV
ncbi:MAG: helix-turn-helix domain-containing protein [Oligoflexus sp.]|nr:helix-turn-helix domain-containing protein [Oligoflexus sp.]